MLDIKFIRENPQLVQDGTSAKHFPVDVSELLRLDAQIREIKQHLEERQATRNRVSKEIGKAPEAEREQLKQQVLSIKGDLESYSQQLREASEQFDKMMLQVAQPAASDVPTGKDDSFNVQVKTWGSLPEFSFKALDHVTLGEQLGMIDIRRGVKIAGSRSYVFKNDGALLEQAILRFTYDYLVEQGFCPVSVPVLVNEAAMEGTGYFPLGRDQAYVCERDGMALVGTSEVSLCSMHADETLPEPSLPLKLMAQSSCFRREAGTYGKDTRGIYRVHQFNKIEMVIFGHADKDESARLHDELLHHAEHVVQSLELPYRVVYVCTGDLGQGQVRKHDIETWMPSREAYGETHSCSTFYDFQSRRLKIRYKDRDGKKQLAYTLNNTACGIPRLLLAILENHQTKDGKITIPQALQPYLGGRTELG